MAAGMLMMTLLLVGSTSCHDVFTGNMQENEISVDDDSDFWNKIASRRQMLLGVKTAFENFKQRRELANENGLGGTIGAIAETSRKFSPNPNVMNDSESDTIKLELISQADEDPMNPSETSPFDRSMVKMGGVHFVQPTSENNRNRPNQASLETAGKFLDEPALILKSHASDTDEKKYEPVSKNARKFRQYVQEAMANAGHEREVFDFDNSSARRPPKESSQLERENAQTYVPDTSQMSGFVPDEPIRNDQNEYDQSEAEAARMIFPGIRPDPYIWIRGGFIPEQYSPQGNVQMSREKRSPADVVNEFDQWSIPSSTDQFSNVFNPHDLLVSNVRDNLFLEFWKNHNRVRVDDLDDLDSGEYMVAREERSINDDFALPWRDDVNQPVARDYTPGDTGAAESRQKRSPQPWWFDDPPKIVTKQKDMPEKIKDDFSKTVDEVGGWFKDKLNL